MVICTDFRFPTDTCKAGYPRGNRCIACEGCPFSGAEAPGRGAGIAAPRAMKPPVEGHDFAVFRRRGSTAVEVKFQEMLEELGQSQGPHAVLLGEVHDDPVTHLLQLAVLQHLGRRCREASRRFVLSMEMFEMDVQNVLDEYVIHNAIREEDMLLDTRPWGNYLTDYRPLVQFCREEGIRVIAANAPRRYVSLVSRKGTEVLDDLQAKNGAGTVTIPLPPFPLPPPSAAYRRKFEETMSMPALQTKSGSCPFIGFSSEDLRSVRPETMQAQLLWDHAMAKSVAMALEEDTQVLHVCGAFHCAHGLGIPEALPRYWSTAVSKVESGSHVGPKACPEGVTSVVCWPASVSATLEEVRKGNVPRPLGAMGDWVIITEETFAESD
eukprot:symbB.v1.2.001270.t1/scaffold64.1/size360880/2